MTNTTRESEPKAKKVRVPEFDETLVRNLSEHVYRQRLGEEDTASMLEKDGDGGAKLRERAKCYDAFSRDYLRAFAAVLP
jgi:hypothetical protein